MDPVLAHFGHWYIETPVYLGPAVVIGVWLKVAEWCQNRASAGNRPNANGGRRPRARRR